MDEDELKEKDDPFLAAFGVPEDDEGHDVVEVDDGEEEEEEPEGFI